MSAVPSLSHAARLVRDFDRERFLTALFAPSERREALLTVYAFNVEIARIRESVHEPVVGLIRLQWWRDALAAAAEGRPGDRHPIAAPLGSMIRSGAVSGALVERLLAGRERDLDPAGPVDLAAAESYAEETSATVTALALAALGADGEDAAAAGRHVGIAWALVGQVRALGFHLSIGRLTLPEDMLRRAGTDGETVLAGRAPAAALAQAARGMADLARHHLGEARRRQRSIGRAALPALLPAVLADGHLATLERAGWNPFDGRVQAARPRPLRLAWANLRGVF